MTKNLVKNKPDVTKVVAPGFRILILPDQDELSVSQDGDLKKHKSGLYIPDKTEMEWTEKQTVLMQTSGVVISIGKTAWKAYDDGLPWCKVGDRVYFKKYSGEAFEGTDGKMYKVINDSDVFLVETL